ncbi:ferrous iron transport protein B [Sunxiuqinia dokdonensis]|uniref:Ferrous iron transport protein B n=1 Tax=Sunxiuqinia dokdonensis TaxID=1409788 RepID=A0A0L8V253_9BACT|nr:ferrous iron transport protein B [Sunxiuqinia dokdonensis]KOH42580.1 iron transporter FeoB [Sunxiuqinia dokdonensis]
MSKPLNVALIGNPNTGKTSIFNLLTGLNQKVGNYPGITVEKKEGTCRLPNGTKAHVVDLPGTYSLNASSADEQLVVETLLSKNKKDYPDVAVVVADVENLKRNLILFTQIKDLQIPAILVVNMADQMERRGISLDVAMLEKKIQSKVVLVSSRKRTGIEQLKNLLEDYRSLAVSKTIHMADIDHDYFDRLQQAFPEQDLYSLWLVVSQDVPLTKIDDELQSVNNYSERATPEIKRLQQKETIARYLFINRFLKDVYQVDSSKATDWRSLLDRVLTHRVGGYVAFFLVMLLIFQAIYNWSSVPMDFIDESFVRLSEWAGNHLPAGPFTSLLAEGIIPGIGGIVIFIPQIAFLFLFISLLEESGYMSRIVFLMDRVMRRFGLSGKSVVPLISGTACAIPAVMAARNIENWKERLITILVTPFTTCSARLPVYLIIIALVIPDRTILGFNLQGLTLMGLYALGFAMAVFSAFILDKILKNKARTFFVIEMPAYKLPLAKNVLYTVIEKTKSFIFGAGKIILAISIVLWFLASNGYSDDFYKADEIVRAQVENAQLSDEEMETAIASYQLRHSYIGILGHTIEPVIRPLGYDWKIGIALVTSFAAREVFVATLATIYSVGSDEEETIKVRMSTDTNARTGEKLFTFPTGISLLLFYAFAMQCMSTLAVVKKETNSWKWPLIQLVLMTGFAYLASMIAFQLLK